MILRASASIVGVILIATGFVLSPVPWLAPIWVGAALVAFGLLTDFGEAGP